MPLPEPNTAWPPPHMDRPHRDMAAWSAWWSGDPDQLTSVYGGSSGVTAERSFERGWTQRGGLVGAVQRWFWGDPVRNGEQRTKLHVPAAAEIAQVSADLLFGQPPTVSALTKADRTKDIAGQAALDRLFGEDMHTLLYEAAESGSALGHSWLRVGLDPEVDPTGPITSQVDADAAYPVYRYGRLVEVTFLSEWCDGGTFVRHLEHHTRGLVEHALYEGTATNIGRLIPLTDVPALTALAPHLVQLTDGRQGIPTGIDELAVIGVPNARTRTWRRNPQAKDLGRADISGVEQELDALDDTWTSWMRDLRHGRSRIHVPQHYLESTGPGKPGVVDIERELYVGFPAMTDSGGVDLTATQFKIRFQEHNATADALLARIYAGAGYSPQTFGMGETAAITAAESFNRQVRTGWTRSAKVRRFRPKTAQLARVLLLMDRAHFRGAVNPEDLLLEVAFPESVAESQGARAQTAQLLSAARAASIDTLVRMTNPDKDDTWIQAEVRLIKDETAASVPDPIGAFGAIENLPGRPSPAPADDPDDGPDDDPDDGPVAARSPRAQARADARTGGAR